MFLTTNLPPVIVMGEDYTCAANVAGELIHEVGTLPFNQRLEALWRADDYARAAMHLAADRETRDDWFYLSAMLRGAEMQHRADRDSGRVPASFFWLAHRTRVDVEGALDRFLPNRDRSL